MGMEQRKAKVQKKEKEEVEEEKEKAGGSDGECMHFNSLRNINEKFPGT